MDSDYSVPHPPRRTAGGGGMTYKRIIAEWCGWKIVERGGPYFVTPPGAHTDYYVGDLGSALPDYEHSLDACAVCEAEGIEVGATNAQ